MIMKISLLSMKQDVYTLRKDSTISFLVLYSIILVAHYHRYSIT
jgi:hypothetical protein